MAVRIAAVRFDVHDPTRAAHFWAELLGRDIVGQADGALLRGDPTQVGLRFVRATHDMGEPRLHLHLTSSSEDEQQRTVAKALDLGGRHLDVGQRTEEGHVVLADPSGNAFCVIEPGNRFLAACGFLGEVTCEGSREVGLFWSAALGWPLVWDQHGETAVQSPMGGTKVSWGGPPVTPKGPRNPQQLDLAADDVQAEVARLVDLGAVVVEQRDGRVELTDPDGNEFAVGGDPE